MTLKHRNLSLKFGIVVAIGAAFSIYAVQNIPMVRFRPVRMDGKQQLQVSRDALTSDQVDRVVGVLQKYGEFYRRTESNVVLITPALRMNTEMVWNYTSKAGL